MVTKVIYLHLHKCGGSALMRYLKETENLTYNEETNGNLSEEQKHIPYQYVPHDIIAYEEHAPAYEQMQDALTICIFRHPVERLWSNYTYDSKYQYIPEMTFREYCLSTKTTNYGLYNMPNLYLRYFGGSIKNVKDRIENIDMVLTLEDDISLYIPVYNQTEDKPEITPSDYEYALELNQGDMEIYNYVQDLRLRRMLSCSKPIVTNQLFRLCLNDYGC